MSIYNKVRIIFLVSLLFVTAFFVAFFYIEKSQHIQEIEKRYMQTSLFLHKHFRQSMRYDGQVDFSDATVKLYLKESSFKLLTDKKYIKNIRKSALVMKKRKFQRSRFQVLRVENRLYLSLDHPGFQLLLLDKLAQTPPWTLLLGYFLSLLFLLLLYVWLTKSLKPLKTLQSRIQKVADGDLSVSVKSDKKDEIAQVSNAFDDALRKLESLIDSRQLFLRTIMHELKTPIGKGKILNAFVEEDKLKDGYDEVFGRLELLLNEFSKIEQMLSSNYELHLANYNAKDLVEQALELMIMDEDALEKQVHVIEESPLILSTDFTLFPLALKNLTDNAIKYAPDHSVEIRISKEGITVSNRGAQFTDEIENYFKPFHGKGEGLGLGLYIVHSIMEMLKLNLSYRYEENKNSFSIITRSV
ncbi:MAG: HAMP domain-containing histidine kinase [Sulfurovum sp.]|nr:HAMP domain-containing histidine kinase [Sulfurovum sp.]NNJ44993.1 HAMP domain-containing histidine kinase [Sulfurovum sp.]